MCEDCEASLLVWFATLRKFVLTLRNYGLSDFMMEIK